MLRREASASMSFLIRSGSCADSVPISPARSERSSWNVDFESTSAARGLGFFLLEPFFPPVITTPHHR